MVSCFNRSSEAIKCTLMTTSLMKLLKVPCQNPKGEIYFAHVPTDWKERVNKCGYNQSLLDSMVESLQDGVSEESVADTLKDFQINGKKISKKL